MLAMTILNLIRQVFTVGMKMVETENYNSKTLKEVFFLVYNVLSVAAVPQSDPVSLTHTHSFSHIQVLRVFSEDLKALKFRVSRGVRS